MLKMEHPPRPLSFSPVLSVMSVLLYFTSIGMIGRISFLLAETGRGLLGDNARVDEVDVAPVVLLDALAVDGGVGVGDGVPEGAAAGVALPGEALGVEEGAALVDGERVVVGGLEGPLADEGRELLVRRHDARLAADLGRQVAREGVGHGKVVHVHVHDQVGPRRKLLRPEGGALEAVLQHHGDARVHRVHFGQHPVHVLEDPVGRALGQALGHGELVEVVGGLVEGRDGEGVEVAAVLHEGEDGVDGGVAVVEVGLIVEPERVAKGLADVEAVDAAGQRVQVDDDVHAVRLDGVGGDGAQELLLGAAVVLGPGHVDPGGVGGGHAQDVDAHAGQRVDGASVEEGGVAGLEDGAAPVAQHRAQRPLVGRLGGRPTERPPPLRVVYLLLGQPGAQVGAVALERPPVKELVTWRTRRTRGCGSGGAPRGCWGRWCSRRCDY